MVDKIEEISADWGVRVCSYSPRKLRDNIRYMNYRMKQNYMLYKRLIQAFQGKCIYNIIRIKYRMDKYIFFPSDNIDFNAWGIIFLPLYIARHNESKIAVFASDIRVYTAIQSLQIQDLIVKRISVNQMFLLMKYYALFDESDKWVVVSVTEPYDTGAEKMLGKFGVSHKEITYFDIFGFSDENFDEEKTIKSVELLKQYLMTGYYK